MLRGLWYFLDICIYIGNSPDEQSGTHRQFYAWLYLNKSKHVTVVERPLCDREVAGSIPGRVIPKTLKMVLAALSLGAQH